jgi:hypothetical protein
LTPDIISELAPTGFLRAGINLSNFLLVTKIDSTGGILMGGRPQRAGAEHEVAVAAERKRETAALLVGERRAKRGWQSVPMLYIVQNNRAYHQEYMYLVAMAARHGRGVDRADIGTTLTNPNIDFATLARGMGVYGEGPIVDPKDLRVRSPAPLLSSNAANRRWWTSSPTRAEETRNEIFQTPRRRGVCDGCVQSWCFVLAASPGRSARRCRERQAPLSRRRVLHLPRPFRARRRLQRSGAKPCQNRHQHYAVFDYFPAVRSGDRVTVKGDKPFYKTNLRSRKQNAAAE